MISLSEQLYNEYAKIQGFNQVSFFYPKTWTENSLPALSFYEQSNSEHIRVDDGQEFLSKVAYQVDVWANKPEECLVLAQKVDEITKAFGLKREFAADLYNQAAQVHHKTLRYGGLIRPDTGEIYQ